MEIEKQSLMSFEEYKEDWLIKHPASIPIETQEDSPYPKWARAAALGAFITSALLSGVHMMPAVYEAIPLSPITDEIMRQWVARGSFVAYELGMFMAAFLMNVPTTKKLAQFLSTIIFMTLIAVNLYSVVKVYGFDLQNNFAGAAVSVMFSLVPAIAYASGKFYINIGTAERATVKSSKNNWRQQNVELDTIILRDYTKYKKQHDTSRNFVKSDEAETLHETSRSPVKPRVKIHEIAEIIYDNGDGKMSANEMMDKYGISLGSTTKIREMLKDRNANGFANGRGLH